MINIIPAIDIIDGKCVRLTQGDYKQKKEYSADPLAIAQSFEKAGIKYLHIVDLEGAKAGQIINAKTLQSIAQNTNLHIDFGGGIKSEKDLELAFECGAKQVTIGSIAVTNRPLFLSWLNKYGADKIILGADVSNGYIAIHGWQEQSKLELFDFLKGYIKEGVKSVICTDISKDGLLQGTALDLYQKIKNQFPTLQLIASGGVTTLNDIHVLNEMHCDGVIIGKAIYEGNIKVTDLGAIQNFYQ